MPQCGRNTVPDSNLLEVWPQQPDVRGRVQSPFCQLYDTEPDGIRFGGFVEANDSLVNQCFQKVETGAGVEGKVFGDTCYTDRFGCTDQVAKYAEIGRAHV